MARSLRDLTTFLVGLIELVLLLRFVLKLLGANPGADYVHWVYTTAEPLLQPFMLAFPTPAIGGKFVLEFTTLFAVFAYAFAGYIMQELLDIVASRSNRNK